MAYEAPKLVEVGDVHDLTLGFPNQAFYRDGQYDYAGPVGSR